jgi:hypothetical protein
MSVVIKHKFSTAPYGQLQELYDRLDDVIDEYAGQVATASVIGILTMLQHDLMQRSESDNAEQYR